LSITFAKQYNVYERRGQQMEFIVVNDSKLKIMMSRADMEEYRIRGDDINYDEPKIRRAFWRILDKAKEKSGFDASGDKVLIQFYPAKDGCEIFVTKLGIISESAERTIAKSTKVAMLETKRQIYKFSSFKSLISAVKAMDGDSYEKMPRVFFDESEYFYLIFERRLCTSGKSKEFSKMSEYGTEIPENLSTYITEHSIEIKFDFVKRFA
jgi:negative regulator of genetic competence, sporulation and motility